MRAPTHTHTLGGARMQAMCPHNRWSAGHAHTQQGETGEYTQGRVKVWGKYKHTRQGQSVGEHTQQGVWRMQTRQSESVRKAHAQQKECEGMNPS